MYSYTVYETDLYVMQNEHGLIKVGQSVDPERRRRQLQTLENCRIALVLALRGKGHREGAIHRKLKKHHIDGEWFDGNDEAREAIGRTIKSGCVLDWPFAFDEAGANFWLDQFFDRRHQRLNGKEFQRLFSRVRTASQPDWTVDADIWGLFWLSEAGVRRVGCDIQEEQGEVVVNGWRPDTEEFASVPRYSNDLAAAMTLWPQEARPPFWHGTALECCVAALRVRQLRLPS